MLDIQNIPNSQDYLKIFYAQGPETWQTWYKPNNAAYVWIMCMGGGAGGYGGGVFGSSQPAPAGGSGAVSKGLFPANFLPDTLYINVGTGSIGGLGVSANSQNPSLSAGRSIVAVQPTASAVSTILASGTAAANGLTAESSFTITINTTVAGLMHYGTIVSLAGQAGGVTTPFGSNMITAGAVGSATTASAGTTIAASAIGNYPTPSIAGGSTGAPGTNGANGVWSWNPMYGLGGAGGGGSTTGTGGNGGNGAYGCGGGGGGSAATGFTGGNGGKGGDGLVFIATF